VKKINKTETFCRSIIGLKVGKSKALANLVNALASNVDYSSVTSLSLHRAYHYQYSSIHDAIDGLYREEESLEQTSRKEVEQALLSIKEPYFPSQFDNSFYLLNTDSTPILSTHSPSLADRSYVHVANNRIKGNRPVGIGHDYSMIGLNARVPLYNVVAPSWNLPLSSKRLKTDEVRGVSTAEQVNALLEAAQSPLQRSLVVNALDRQYGTPEYIVDTYKQDNLINVIRLKSNRVVWEQLTAEQTQERRVKNADNRGANAVYGQKYKLSQVDQWDKTADEEQRFGVSLCSTRRVVVKICKWNNRLIRSKRGKNMKDKPFDLISIELLDPLTNAPIYKNRLWLGVWGKRKEELTLEQIYWSYRLRFDEEHAFRFSKQHLFMDAFQTPDVEHLDNWMEIVHLAYWLLWVARDQAKPECYKWQQYDPNYKNRLKYDLPPTPSEVQRQLEAIILSFDQEPFKPKPKIKTKGRQKGQVQPKRKQHKVVYKNKNKRKKRA